MRKFLLSRWLLSLVGTALLAGLVWLFGPFVAVLEGVWPRAAVLGVLALLWGGANLLLDWRNRRREATLAKGVTAADPSAAAVGEEVAALRERLACALAVLRKARGTRGYLYEQPWYVIIGPPGAGKTTALLNSGLRFPLAGEMGEGALAGVGGTRLCDWWFTDTAVLIDTAGRYTTQDSDAAVDRAGWEAFLGLLRRTRPRRPLNGVVVAIALSDIAQAPREERLAHAAAVRRRLKELRDRLGVRLPVYALFTKADLIAGFTEFFDDLDRDRRAQVWGTTFALGQPETGSVAAFPPAFQALVGRLEARLLERMQAERSPDRRALIAGFPAQVASLGAALQEFLESAFAGSRLDPAPMLRGAYFTSGTQEGTPIDRLTGALAKSFGLDQRRAPSLRPEHGRGYFLGRLLKQVILGEAMLVADPPGAARRRLLLRAGAAAAVVLAVLAGGGLLWRADASNRAAIDGQDQALAAFRQAVNRLGLGPVTDGDLARVLPVLDQARAVADVPPTGGFGPLAQGDKLAEAGATIYRHTLERVLLPRLVWRLETQMRGALTQPDFLYEATRVYLMLGGLGPLDRDLVRGWMALDWQRQFPDPAGADSRKRLAGHLDALLAQPLPAIALDGGLVEQARAVFSRLPLAQRIYSRIAPSAAAQKLPPWRPADALGAGGAPYFQRISGKPLSDGIPGLYTPDGLQYVLLPALAGAAREVASESWVLGQQNAVASAGPQLDTLEHDVLALYAADYVRQWDALLADLSLVPPRSLPQAAEQLYVLGSPQSPMRDLLNAIAKQLAPSVAPAPAAAAAKAVVPAALQQVLGAPAAAPAGQQIDDHYRALRDYLGKPGQPAPFDRALQAVNGLQQDLARLAAAPSAGVPATGPDPVLPLKAEASEAPQPVQRWLMAIAEAGTALRAGGARQAAAAAFNGSGGAGPLCMRAVSGRYPFVAGAASAIPLDDFTRLFAPGGLLDSYFNDQLRPFADTSGRLWKVNDAAGAAAPVSTAELTQFQLAAEIRAMFFPAGATPLVRLEITPVDLDAGARQVTLDLGGASVSYAHGPPQPAQVSWPAQGAVTARLTFDPPAAGGPLTASGPWALFRLIDKGSLASQGTPDSFLLAFRQGERHASFAIRAGSVVNPLSRGALEEFRCPVLH